MENSSSQQTTDKVQNTENEAIVNRVAKSSLITFDLEEYYDHHERVVFDLEECLYQGLILREKEFRNYISEKDWSAYEGKNVAITCSADAIVPIWAYMLVMSKVEPRANFAVFGDLDDLERALYYDKLARVDFSRYQDARIVVKGCGHYPVPTFAYAEAVRRLRPYAKTIMYGEPCSTVPVYKRPRKTQTKGDTA